MNVRRAIVAAYHQRSKHALQRYAAGPQTLDWDSQPDPFRRFDGAPLTWLPLAAARLAPTWDDLFVPGRIAPAACACQASQPPIRSHTWAKPKSANICA